nr:transposase [Streptomyces inhibens]
MLDAVRHVVDNGFKWADLPADFLSYRRVHAVARRWQVTGLLAEPHDRLRGTAREKGGRTPGPGRRNSLFPSNSNCSSVSRGNSVAAPGWPGSRDVYEGSDQLVHVNGSSIQ